MLLFCSNSERNKRESSKKLWELMSVLMKKMVEASLLQISAMINLGINYSL